MNVYYNHGRSNSKGVMTLVDKSLDYKIIKQESDKEARYLIQDMYINDKMLTLINL